MGSLKEALFLTVWLRRKEESVFATRLLAQGLIDLIHAQPKTSEENAKPTAEVFKQYLAAAFPFMKKTQAADDKKLKEAMEREVQRGMIVFNAPQANPLVQRAKTMALPDEFRKRLVERRGKRIVEA